MNIRIETNRIALFMAVICFAASFLNAAYPSAPKIMAVCALIILLVALFRDDGSICVHIGAFHILTISFILYCFCSALWAVDGSISIMRANTNLKLLIALFLIYFYYQDEKKAVNDLLQAVILGGYLVCIVMLASQGVNTYLNGIQTATRVYDEDYINANIMGMLSAFSILLNFYLIIYKKQIRWWTILMIPAFICMAGAGSKKSILTLVIGGCLIILMHNYSRGKILSSLMKIVFWGSLFFAVIYLLSKSSMFALLVGRMDGLINFIVGKGKVDGSTKVRAEMIRIGMKLFRKNPLIGVGVGNAGLFNYAMGKGVYLHNNYIELLAGGGLIGCGLYYLMYVYLLFHMWKYRAYRDDEYDICLILILVRLILDMGYVSYYNKDTYFYLMLFFLEVRRLKQTAWAEQPAEEGVGSNESDHSEACEIYY